MFDSRRVCTQHLWCLGAKCISNCNVCLHFWKRGASTLNDLLALRAGTPLKNASQSLPNVSGILHTRIHIQIICSHRMGPCCCMLHQRQGRVSLRACPGRTVKSTTSIVWGLAVCYTKTGQLGQTINDYDHIRSCCRVLHGR